MRGPALLLLCAVALTHSVNPTSGQNAECNCNPSEAWQICDANWDKDNVLIAHEYCDRFYTCSNGRPVAQRCPSGLLYNPYTEVCDWAVNVDCGDRPISDGQDLEDEDCDEDDAENGVVDGDNENNGDSDAEGDNNGNDNGASDNGSGDNSASDNGGSDNVAVGGGNCDPSEAPSICAADDSEDVLVAHENCNQFYICAGGKPVALKCPNNLLFNPNTDQCDWPENVDCGDRVIPEPEDSDNDGSDNDSSDNGSGGNGGGDNEGSDNGGSDNGGSDNGGGGTCNCNPGEAPEICVADGSDGVLVANENCNQFYICANGKPVIFSCPPNLLYNPYTEQCDWPENVECGDRVIPDPEDNNNGGSDNGGSGNGGSDNGDNNNDDSDNGTVGGGNCDPSEAPSICAADESDGVLVANEYCNKYYICNGGKPVAMPCPAGLLFNPAINQCDWPENVDCGDRVIPDPEDNNNGGSDNGGSDNGGSVNGGSDNGGSDNGGGGTCNCNPGEAPEICVADGSDGVLVANENCNQFYICANGKPVVFSCPSNLLYNPYTEQCDWPENVECGDRVIPDPEDNNNGGSDNGGSDNGGSDNGGSDNGGSDNGGSDNGTVGGGNCDPNEAPSICAADESDGVLVANEYCNKYYICNGGKPVAMPCPAGLLFNPAIDQCDWPENVDCGDRVIPDPEDNNNGGSDNGGSDNGGSDNGGSDNGGSDNGGSDNGGSDNGGSDNGGGGTCNCNPGEAPEICVADGSDGVLVANENCNQFYICANGKPVVFSCPPNLLYNPYTEQCDWPENVECGDRVIPDPEDNNNGGSDNSGNDNGGSDNGGSDNGGTDNGGSGSCNCNPGEAPEICGAEGSDGLLIANENCNQFYICSYGKPVVLTCPSNLLYNPYTEKCDWPENVECGDRIIPDPEDNDNGGSDNGGSDNGGSDNGGSDNDGSDNGGSGTCNCNPGEAPEICAAEGSDGVLIANENCNQFYICSYGKPVVLTCPSNLLYNPYTEKCDWPENVECGDRIIPDPEDNDNGGSDNGGSDNGGSDNGGSDNGGSDNGGSDNEDSDNGDSDNEGSDNGGNDNGTCNCNPGEAPEICAADGSEGVLVAHENCNQFYTCNNGRPVVLSCPVNLLYNPNTEQCDWPENVDCGDRVIPDPEDNDNNDNNNDSSDDGGSDNVDSENGGSDNGGNDNNDNGSDSDSDDSNNNVYDDPSQAPGICADGGSNGVFIAHENCDQYYMCTSGLPVAFTCPGDLLFNPLIQQCDWPRAVDCGDRVVPDVEGCLCNPRRAPALCAGENSEGLVIAHEICNQFYVCAGGVPVARSCPGALFYNPLKEVCDWPMNVDCGMTHRVSPILSLNKHLESRQTLRK